MAGLRLTRREIRDAFSDEEAQAQFPPVLSVDQASDLLSISTSTLYEWVSRGRLDGTVRKRGKHLMFWRDRLIDRIFNGEDWS